MGRGHSGTRILAWICEQLGIRLGAVPGKDTADPADLRFTRAIKKIAMRNLGLSDPAAVRDRDLRRFRRAVGQYIRGLQPSGPWGWKFPETYLIAPVVYRAFPDARYLHLVRDGRDIAFKHHLTDDPGRKLGRALLSHVGALSDPHPVQAARSWAFQVQTFAAFRRHVPALPVLDLTFEDLVQDPIASTRRVCDFLGMPFTEEARAWIETRIDPGKIAQYRDQDPSQIRAVEEAIGPILVEYGYPVDCG
jgi:hypothetical protein